MDLNAKLEKSLADRKDAQLYRSRLITQGPQGVELLINGTTYLNFCSNDYLGLANHADVIAAFKKGADSYGVGSGAAHLVSGHSQVHHLLEEELAEFVQRPRALLFSTGYMANLGVVGALLGRNDAVFEDRLNHASLIDAGVLSQAQLVRYQHADMDVLSKNLLSSDAKNKLVVSDGVFSMDGDVAPLVELAKVANNNNAWLMIDDAHGIGVIGKTGRGSLEEFNMDLDNVPVLVGTLGKAFGTFGAFVAGSETLIETLIQQARSYIYTTALPPAVAEATRTSLQFVIKDSWRRQHLNLLITRFRQGAEQLGLPLMSSQTPIQPLLIGAAEHAVSYSKALWQLGFLITAIRPPTVPTGSARLRITFCASHTEQHVDRLLEALASVNQSLGMTSSEVTI